jgi:hypothetical protein
VKFFHARGPTKQRIEPLIFHQLANGKEFQNAVLDLSSPKCLCSGSLHGLDVADFFERFFQGTASNQSR